MNLRDSGAFDPTIVGMLQTWADHPVAMVREEFGVEPDPWQVEALEAFPHHNRIALKASKGPGKTATLSWLILNFLATRPHCRIGATSITGDNLFSNLWPELAKWMGRSKFLSSLYEWQKTRLVHRFHGSTWWCQARTWPKSADPTAQSDALAGLHEDYAMFVLDESGGIPQALMTTAEAVLAGGVETKVLQAGNPTTRSGPLYRACITDAHLWKVITITGDPDNPMRSPRVSPEWAREQIAAYGRENPWVLVNVLGEFPPTSLNALLGDEDVTAAMGRTLKPDAFEWAQKRLGIDVARYGDDRTIIFPRQGLAAFMPITMRHARDSNVSTDIATKVLACKARWGSELEFIDATGGWGAGTRDVLMASGCRTVINVQFGGPATDKTRFANKRAEMWWKGAEWVKLGGALPPIPELIAELIEPTYTVTSTGAILVEPKDLIKARIGRSPDLADSLFTTFAMPEQPAGSAGLGGRSVGKAVTDYDPMRDA